MAAKTILTRSAAVPIVDPNATAKVIANAYTKVMSRLKLKQQCTVKLGPISRFNEVRSKVIHMNDSPIKTGFAELLTNANQHFATNMREPSMMLKPNVKQSGHFTKQRIPRLKETTPINVTAAKKTRFQRERARVRIIVRNEMCKMKWVQGQKILH